MYLSPKIAYMGPIIVSWVLIGVKTPFRNIDCKFSRLHLYQALYHLRRPRTYRLQPSVFSAVKRLLSRQRARWEPQSTQSIGGIRVLSVEARQKLWVLVTKLLSWTNLLWLKLAPRTCVRENSGIFRMWCLRPSLPTSPCISQKKNQNSIWISWRTRFTTRLKRTRGFTR